MKKIEIDEIKLEKKFQHRERKKRKKMKVVGKEVFKLQNIVTRGEKK